MKNELNENIKELRLARGISQVEFAKKLCVTKQCVSNWENDNVLPSIEMLQRIADFFSVSTDYLLGREREKSLNVDGLTDKQVDHLRALVCDFKELNK